LILKFVNLLKTKNFANFANHKTQWQNTMCTKYNTSSWKSIAYYARNRISSNKPKPIVSVHCRFASDYTNKEWRITKNKYLQYSRSMACLRIDVNKVVFYRQSDVPQTAELSWYLSCFFLSTIDISTFIQR
jgi:hypothetical protein